MPLKYVKILSLLKLTYTCTIGCAEKIELKVVGSARGYFIYVKRVHSKDFSNFLKAVCKEHNIVWTDLNGYVVLHDKSDIYLPL